MTVIVFILSALLLFAGCWFFCKKLKTENDSLRCKNDELKKIVSALSEENVKLRAELSARQDEIRMTNEKIDRLHSGDSVSNAIAGLSKRKSRDS